ncbi:carbohydrate ABC transporter substrate-binding protein [Faecalicatena contorta]|uniref:ABC transporter substrate-binding protein n=1 Tax=Faecalicatena contorta TaxID=39482 RepID=UPI00129EE5CD|nr:ABC transporter substrate-binding protein [Faecalicatena contorta]MRM88928.1 carbohydrate ABC transporter substrate-binding protein [Faecalicatena contorta]
MKRKSITALMLGLTATVVALGGCGADSKDKDGTKTGDKLTKDMEATLKIACFSPTDSEYYAENDLQGAFQELYPNVSIEVEEYKDTGEYQNAMKVRISAKELPDIMYLQPDMITTYQDYLVDLTDIEAAADNIYSEDYQTDGGLFALPASSGETYVYYWKDMFDEAGIEVPDTWEEFTNACTELSDYYSKENPDFVALGMGAKDEWPTYPFMEYMPALTSGNGAEWTHMANVDAPFKEGESAYEAYKKVYDLFSSGVCGKDPLGVGHDQIASLFYEKKVGMMVFAPTLYEAMKDAGVDVSELSTFYLPVRNSEEEEFRTLVAGNKMFAVTKDGENPELAKAFLDFFFSEQWYPDYINSSDDGTALKSIQKEKETALQAADDLQPDPVKVRYQGGSQSFMDIVSKTKFDYKKLGAQFFIKDYDFEGEMERLNDLWKSAREELGLTK